MKHLLSTDELQSKAEELREEMVVVSELSRQNIEQNASMALDQDEFQQRDRSLSERFQRVSDQLHEVEAEYAKRTHKRRELEQFMKNLRSIEQLVNEFDEMLWISMVKKVVVATDGRMTFTFTNDMEITV